MTVQLFGAVLMIGGAIALARRHRRSPISSRNGAPQPIPSPASIPPPRKVPILPVLAVGLALQVAVPRACFAKASAHASSGSWLYKDDMDSDSVWAGKLSWASTSSINWTLPTATVNGAAVATAPLPKTEPKFSVPAVGFPTAITWAGYSYSAGKNPIAGSNAFSIGAGSSNVGAAFYGANWTVTADGYGTYDIKAVAKDPWNITKADLAGFGSKYSLFIPFGILGGQSSGSGNGSQSSFGFDVTYQTKDGLSTLLQVDISGSKAIVTPSSAFGSSLLFYREGAGDEGPSGTTVPGTLMSAGDIQTFLNNDLAPDGSLEAPLYLGVVLSGISVPQDPMEDGAVASIGVDSYTSDAAVAPAPPAWLLLSTGLAALAVVGRLRHRQSIAVI